MEKIITGIKEIYDLYQEPVTNERLALLVRNLQHYDEQVVLAAITNLKFTRTTPYVPKWPDFLAEIKAVFLAQHLSGQDAWELVLQKVSRGHKGYAELPETVCRAVDKVCTWDALRNTDNTLYYRSAFITAYSNIIEESVKCQLKP